mmetsp:Transcript_53583/g.139601  ORF Transcript_53583/g.139601 Transcript_53583/m.139601 type:complete len:345 (-) Transcript_53583:531-1565(-)
MWAKTNYPLKVMGALKMGRRAGLPFVKWLARAETADHVVYSFHVPVLLPGVHAASVLHHEHGGEDVQKPQKDEERTRHPGDENGPTELGAQCPPPDHEQHDAGDGAAAENGDAGTERTCVHPELVVVGLPVACCYGPGQPQAEKDVDRVAASDIANATVGCRILNSGRLGRECVRQRGAKSHERNRANLGRDVHSATQQVRQVANEGGADPYHEEGAQEAQLPPAEVGRRHNSEQHLPRQADDVEDPVHLGRVGLRLWVAPDVERLEKLSLPLGRADMDVVHVHQPFGRRGGDGRVVLTLPGGVSQDGDRADARQASAVGGLVETDRQAMTLAGDLALIARLDD